MQADHADQVRRAGADGQADRSRPGPPAGPVDIRLLVAPTPGCGCRELGHVMRPADTRVPGHRGGLVVAAERSLRGAWEWVLRAGADRAIGVDGGCCSARDTRVAQLRGGAVR